MARFSFHCRVNSLFQILAAVVAIYLLTMLFNLNSFRSGYSVTLPEGVSIDDVISGYYNYDPGPLQYLPRSCRPRHNLVFIKCMKCATETLGSIYRRYGYIRNLTYVLPVQNRIYLGWPYPMGVHDYRPSSRGYNILMEHAIYNGTFMRNLMNPETAFITMIREPMDMFVSVLNYFNVFQLANASFRHGMKAVQVYLRNIDIYEEVYKSRAASPKRYCIPDGFSITKNLMSHCLGVPLGFPAWRPNITSDLKAVRRYIDQLHSEFLLVMIMEYFEESLVLLKRLMCWEIKDIIYHSSNLGSYRKNNSFGELTGTDRDIHRKWSAMDYLLYDHFNRTFWRKVQQQGDDFHQEVAYFKQTQHQVTWFCQAVAAYGESFIRFPESMWSAAFTFSSEDCQVMAAPLLEKLKERYQQQEPPNASFVAEMNLKKIEALC